MRPVREVTSDLVYVRLHGPDGPYQGSYDNDRGDAVKNAIEMQELIGAALL